MGQIKGEEGHNAAVKDREVAQELDQKVGECQKKGDEEKKRNGIEWQTWSTRISAKEFRSKATVSFQVETSGAFDVCKEV